MHKKIKAHRIKKDEYWISIFTEFLDSTTVHIGVCINKSKRAQNDWYRTRKNRRARKVSRTNTKRHHKYLIALNKLLKQILNKLKPNTAVVMSPNNSKTESMHRYVQRLGFTPILSDGLWVWVLIIPQSWEESHPTWRTR